MKFDLLVKGGEVIDPAAGYSGRLDVGIKRNRVVTVERDIPADAAFRVIDATDQYVTPGLVDLHSHVYRSASHSGVHADSIASRTGVTTWVDAGSAGALTLSGLREFIIKHAEVRVYCFVNISSIGLAGFDYELTNLEYCDVNLCRSLVDQNRDIVLGIKIRMGASTVGPNEVEPLRRARQAADLCELPLMVHIAQSPPHIAEVLRLLRPGDIVTHCYTGQTMGIIDEDGKILDAAKRAWETGVIFDIGHGAGSFSWDTAEALMSAGYKPHTISTDMHQITLNGPMFDLPTCLSKLMYLGMSLAEVVRAATSRPAEVLGLDNEIGTLKSGALADLALFRVAQGRFPLYDSQGKMREAKQLLYNTLAVVNGRELPRRAPEPLASWIDWATKHDSKARGRMQFQNELRKLGHVPSLMISAEQQTLATDPA
jgi:dihydroorotase